MEEQEKAKLWGGRFRKQEDDLMAQFNNNFEQTKWLYEADILGSMAHVAMQTQVGLLTQEEGAVLTKALEALLAEIQSGELALEGDYEDIHTFVELQLTARVGEVGKKLHTARSRNDQCNLDMKLYVRQQVTKTLALAEQLKTTLKAVAEKHPCIMPGYTHLQRAQVITFKAHLMAYHGMLTRDGLRLQNALVVMDENPLGCGALAGTTHAINRQITTTLLGFAKPYDNFLDGVSDRDFCLEAMSDFSILMMHLSLLAEELVLWTSQEFGFVELDDRYTTGSSIMPQKKNSDGAELIRGKTGRVYGNLFALLTVMKGLPLAYNKDMQEDKEAFYDSAQTVQACLTIMERMIATLSVNSDKMKAAVKKGFLNATEVADYLVAQGMPFRDAHTTVGQLVIYCEDRGIAIEDLSESELASFSELLGPDLYAYIDYDNILQKGIKCEML